MVLAGGRSRRFGSDKALARLDGARLIDWAVSALRREVGDVVLVGRQDPAWGGIADWPGPGLGPLGGLAGGLRHAVAEGYDQVLTIPVDCVAPPEELLALLSPGPACVEGAPVIGLWPVSALPIVERLVVGDDRSVRAFASAIGARFVAMPGPIANVNTADDLAALADRARGGRG